jgi:hypothetical protein
MKHTAQPMQLSEQSAYDVMVRIRRRAGIDADLVTSGNQDPYMVAQRDAGKDAFRTFMSK